MHSGVDIDGTRSQIFLMLHLTININSSLRILQIDMRHCETCAAGRALLAAARARHTELHVAWADHSLDRLHSEHRSDF